MGPSALSAGIFESGMYYYVLCRIRKSPLSRIWTHLVRLAGTRRICIHLLWQEGFGSRAYTAMYYVTAKIPAFAHLDPSRAPGRKPQDMHPPALEGGIWKPGIYGHVLCYSQNLLLSRIWTHLVRLAGTRRICIHLLWQEGFGSRAYTAMYYVTAKICCFRVSGYISRVWRESELSASRDQNLIQYLLNQNHRI